jgi:quercetin dioxygenase-like cupin family protein
MEVLSWDKVPVEELTDKIRRQVVTGRNEMMARVLLDKGAVVHTHSHESEQITYIIEGAMRLMIGEPPEEVLLKAGQFIVHRAEVLEDTVDIDVFSPIRQDWLDGRDTYFHKEE